MYLPCCTPRMFSGIARNHTRTGALVCCRTAEILLESASGHGTLHVPCLGLSVPNPRNFHQLESRCRHECYFGDAPREPQVCVKFPITTGVFHSVLSISLSPAFSMAVDPTNIVTMRVHSATASTVCVCCSTMEVRWRFYFTVDP